MKERKRKEERIVARRQVILFSSPSSVDIPFFFFLFFIIIIYLESLRKVVSSRRERACHRWTRGHSNNSRCSSLSLEAPVARENAHTRGMSGVVVVPPSEYSSGCFACGD